MSETRDPPPGDDAAPPDPGGRGWRSRRRKRRAPPGPAARRAARHGDPATPEAELPPVEQAARRRLRRERLADAAAALPLVGVLLLVSPIPRSVGAETLGGAPLALVYLFGVWGALIAAAVLIGRAEARVDAAEDADVKPTRARDV